LDVRLRRRRREFVGRGSGCQAESFRSD
jgi:hypothetical protein